MGYNNSTVYSESLALAPKSAIFFIIFLLFFGVFTFWGVKRVGVEVVRVGVGTISKVL